MTDDRPEVLVVGAGSAGAAAAAFLSEGGRHVVVVDSRPQKDAGARWANGVPGWCFDDAGLERPEPPERLRAGAVFGAVLCNADGSRRVHVPADPLVHLSMPTFIARLQERGRAAGAEFQRARVVGVEKEGQRVIGVRIATGHGERLLRPGVTVDASGMAAAVRRHVPALQTDAPLLRPNDICVAEQFQHAIADQGGARDFLARHQAQPGDGVSFMGRAGGYSVLMAGVDPGFEEVAVLAGSIPADGVPDGVALRRAFLDEHPWIGAPIRGGSASIPLGPPLHRLVAPGVAALGDAANQVFCIHGSGVGMGLLAARHLADAVAGARDPGDLNSLLGYQVRFVRTYGGRLAAADVFRRFSQTLSQKDMTTLIETGLLTSRMLSVGLMQAPFVADAPAPGPLASGLRKAPGLLARVAVAGARMMALQGLYGRFPPSGREEALGRFQAAARALRGY